MKENYFLGNIIEQDMKNIFKRNISYSTLKGKNILITGATGMLASYLVYFLIWLNEYKKFNMSIIVLVRSYEKCRSCFGKYMERKYFSVRFDNVCAAIDIESDIDYIIHAASLASPQHYGVCPVDVAAPNVLGTYYLLELAKKKKVNGFLYFSSGDVYGKMPFGTGSFGENVMGIMDPLEPHSCYGESKRMGETWCKSFYRQYDVPVYVARIAHTYGPMMDIENDPRVFASFMKCLIHKEDIKMLSDGTAKRPFCYIADAIAAFFIILLSGKAGEAYNMSNECEFISIKDLAEKILSLDPSGKLKIVKKQRGASEVYMENVNNKDNCLSSKKLCDLGWRCEFDVLEGFRRVFLYQMELKYGEEG